MTDERRGRGTEHEESPESRFTTDQDPLADVVEPETELLEHEPASATVLTEEGPDLSVLDVRPSPGQPREYRFPPFERTLLASGLTVVTCHMPGRPLLAASLLLPGGGSTEPVEQAGVSVLMSRALTEGTQRLDAIEFIEASERLGAEIHADTTWDASVVSLEVPRSRFGPAIGLLAEMLLEPAFPAPEVDRLREERINDLLQARADPRRRAERVFAETIFDPSVAYGRPLGGSEATVPGLDREAVLSRHRALLGVPGATLVVAGDVDGLDVPALAREHLGGWAIADGEVTVPPAAEHAAGPRTVLVNKRSAPQSEVRIGHLGLPRRTADFHAVSVLNAVLGGTFDSRLNRLLREDRGYTYSISSSFEMRRARGPFAIRTAVHSETTVPALLDAMSVVRGVREAELEQRELSTARDYLVGVFPLRFESPAQVCAALSGLVIQQLPDDELDRYRPAIAAVTGGEVLAAAQRHIHPDELSIVVVGDAATLESQLRHSDLPPLQTVLDE
ncbi:MAG TPA: pitrilysin family protein [Candidatus Limnocylindrales bacterium]|nr:pitrilysin family protein [Candidatus Limnocylindrales bacterium]